MVNIYVLLVLCNEADNSVLLLQRPETATFGAGLYSLPGGKVEHNETVSDALVREAAEELGIVLDKNDCKLIHTIHRKGTESNFIALFFKAKYWQGNIENREPKKCVRIDWFLLNQLPQAMIEAHHQSLKNIQKSINYSEHGWK